MWVSLLGAGTVFRLSRGMRGQWLNDLRQATNEYPPIPVLVSLPSPLCAVIVLVRVSVQEAPAVASEAPAAGDKAADDAVSQPIV